MLTYLRNAITLIFLSLLIGCSWPNEIQVVLLALLVLVTLAQRVAHLPEIARQQLNKLAKDHVKVAHLAQELILRMN